MSDPLPIWLAGWGLAVATPAAILLAVLSALFERSGPIRLRHWAEEAGRSLRRLYDRPARFEAFRFLLSLSAWLLPVLIVGLLWSLFGSLRVAAGWWLAPVVVAVFLTAVEGLNRLLVESHAENALGGLTVVARILYALFRPAAWVLEHLFSLPESRNGDDEDEVSDEEIDAFIDVGRREGILEPAEEDLVRSIVDFGDTQVRSVMTPRVEMRSAPVDTGLEELARIFFDSKHARLPLYRESVDQIAGILHIRDLFEAIDGGRDVSAAELVNPPYYVPETKPLRELLEELQKRGQQMAIVVDEYGGVAGLVTVEDLVEEIVGEIRDEHEEDAPQQAQIDENRWRLAGRTDLTELGELFGLDFDDLPYETVSGLVCGELGYVPKAGEVFASHGLDFAVEEADKRRVTSVVVGRTVPAQKGET